MSDEEDDYEYEYDDDDMDEDKFEYTDEEEEADDAEVALGKSSPVQSSFERICHGMGMYSTLLGLTQPAQHDIIHTYIHTYIHLHRKCVLQ
jgi:hypothetical protein